MQQGETREKMSLDENYNSMSPVISKAMLLACVVGLLIALYSSTFYHIAQICYQDDAYSHGLILPFVTLFLLYERRGAVVRASTAAKPLSTTQTFCVFAVALCALLGGMLLFFIGEASDSLFSRWVSFVPAAFGALLLAFGPAMGRIVIPPVLLLFLAKPLPDSLVPILFSPLQTLAAQVSATTLEFLAVPVHAVGNIIEIPGMQLQVEEACSGMRSLMALLCAAAIVVLSLELRWYLELGVLLFAVLVALALNIARVALTGVLAHFVSPSAASGFFHTFSGLVVFLLGLTIVYAVTSWLDAMTRKT